jgi:hypothetical protein
MDFDCATSPSPDLRVITFIALALGAAALRSRRAVRRHGHNIRNVIVVGRDENGFDLASRLARRGDLGYAIEAVIEVKPHDEGETLQQVTALLENRPIDEVFITLPLDAHQALIRDVVGICEEQGVTIRVLSGLVDLIVARAQLDEIDGRPVVTIFSGPPDSLLLAVKRMMDVTVSGLARFCPRPSACCSPWRSSSIRAARCCSCRSVRPRRPPLPVLQVPHHGS